MDQLLTMFIDFLAIERGLAKILYLPIVVI